MLIKQKSAFFVKKYTIYSGHIYAMNLINFIKVIVLYKKVLDIM